MGLYRIADTVFDIRPQSERLNLLLQPFAAEADPAPIHVPCFSPESEVFETLCFVGSHFLRQKQGLLIHGAAVLYKGKVYLFTAPSGTGKSTHAALWLQRKELNARILNGDKPIVRLDDTGITVYGSPWQGKENLGFNGSAPLGGIYLLRRGTTDYVQSADTEQAIAALLDATVYPDDPRDMGQLLELLDKLLQSVPVQQLSCTVSQTAVDAVLATIH